MRLRRSFAEYFRGRNNPRFLIVTLSFTCRRNESEEQLPEERDRMHNVIETGRARFFSVFSATTHRQSLYELLFPRRRADKYGSIGPLNQFVDSILKQRYPMNRIVSFNPKQNSLSFFTISDQINLQFADPRALTVLIHHPRETGTTNSRHNFLPGTDIFATTHCAKRS